MYNAISRICSGNYSLSAELRLAVCIVLVLCWDAIDADVRQKRQIALPKDNVYNTEHDETLTQILGRASRIGGYAGKYELSAISQVINGPINVLYPSPYGKKDKRIQLFGGIHGNTKKLDQFREVKLIWYSTQYRDFEAKNAEQKRWDLKEAKLCDMYDANHYAPLLRNPKTSDSIPNFVSSASDDSSDNGDEVVEIVSEGSRGPNSDDDEDNVIESENSIGSDSENSGDVEDSDDSNLNQTSTKKKKVYWSDSRTYKHDIGKAKEKMNRDLQEDSIRTSPFNEESSKKKVSRELFSNGDSSLKIKKRRRQRIISDSSSEENSSKDSSSDEEENNTDSGQEEDETAKPKKWIGNMKTFMVPQQIFLKCTAGNVECLDYVKMGVKQNIGKIHSEFYLKIVWQIWNLKELRLIIRLFLCSIPCQKSSKRRFYQTMV